ncbi:hypothetical protein AADEFJLK_02759 [Methylovulum psychrotolerans]|uniref:Uncharacterized protein n=1 Tax=Methylovulum psychrotolerans TaxID=1704499 RepID=A0A2S5CKH0_9GAMM|nr:hypothetical protein AADEFJLK_02759 [Methylovulum psychrotolerans]
MDGQLAAAVCQQQIAAAVIETDAADLADVTGKHIGELNHIGAATVSQRVCPIVFCDQVGVVARAALQGIVAGAAIEGVVAAITD